MSKPNTTTTGNVLAETTEKAPELTPIRVTWVDSSSNSGWMSFQMASTFPLAICTSVGYLVSEDDDSIVLALSACPPVSIGCVLAIPKGCIIERAELKE